MAGCTTPGTYRVFKENIRSRPDEAVLVEEVPNLNARGTSPETVRLHAMVIHRGQGSQRSLARWHRANANFYAPHELPFRLGWAHGLFVVNTSGNMEQLKRYLRENTPVLVVLQRSAVNPASRRDVLIIGYDNHDRVMLSASRGNDPYTLIPYDDFEREWRVAKNRMTVFLPPGFDARPLDAMELFERARYHEDIQALGDAVADYRSAAEAGMGQSALHVRLGNTLRNMDKPDEAAEAYRKAISADPQNAQGYNNLAYLMAEQSSELAEAERLARQAMILDPANPVVLDTVGFVLYQQERYREAADVLERARGRARWHPPEVQAEIAFRLVRAHLRNGDMHLAREVYRDAVRIAPADQVPPDLRELLK